MTRVGTAVTGGCAGGVARAASPAAASTTSVRVAVTRALLEASVLMGFRSHYVQLGAAESITFRFSSFRFLLESIAFHFCHYAF